MCGRYNVTDSPEVQELMGQLGLPGIAPRPEGHGYRPNPKFHTFNARSDRLTSSPLWKKVYPSHRCIVPVSAFHEW